MKLEATLDNVVELLVRHSGRSPLEAPMIMVPETSRLNQTDAYPVNDFTNTYRHSRSWDGSALLVFSDGLKSARH